MATPRWKKQLNRARRFAARHPVTLSDEMSRTLNKNQKRSVMKKIKKIQDQHERKLERRRR